jgi:hypothetical protein
MSLPQRIEPLIFTLRGQRVMLDSDLAVLYGVSTKRLNEQVKRNRKRFPSDFLFQLKPEEAVPSRSQFATLKGAQNLRPQFATSSSDVENDKCLRSQFATLKKGRGEHRKYLPYAFTEHGALMAANVLNSRRAISMSVYVIRAFVRMRELLTVNDHLENRLLNVEKTLSEHDQALRELFKRIKPLLLPPDEKPKKRIGFHALYAAV